jgi:predicted TIM-barrel fold metal-dependent hydrolase
MEPGAYFRRQFYATFEDDAIGVLTRHFIGVDNLIWGNDYPHHDSIWPHSQEIIARIFAGVPEDEKAQMTFGNVTRLYGLTPPGAAAA